MKDFSQYQKVGQTSSNDVYIAESDSDILIVVPQKGTLDTAQGAREFISFMYHYAQTQGRPCSCVIILANVLSQEAEARRAYQEIDPKQVYAAALIVDNALSRALASFFVGLSRPIAPTKLFDTVENGVEWLKTMRPH